MVSLSIKAFPLLADGVKLSYIGRDSPGGFKREHPMSDFKKGLTSPTIVDDLQTIDPTRIRAWLASEARHEAGEGAVVVKMLEELVDLVDQSEFLNTVRQERMDHVASDMAADAKL